jgi:hypothetical protein
MSISLGNAGEHLVCADLILGNYILDSHQPPGLARDRNGSQ